MVLEKDVAVPLRDGVTIYVDVFRPVRAEQVPFIVAWSPYGKGQGTSPSMMGIFGMVGLDNGVVSGLEKFEGPGVVCDRQEGEDCDDLVEWLAGQSWCSGKVAMSGTSYLAVSLESGCGNHQNR